MRFASPDRIGKYLCLYVSVERYGRGAESLNWVIADHLSRIFLKANGDGFMTCEDTRLYKTISPNVMIEAMKDGSFIVRYTLPEPQE